MLHYEEKDDLDQKETWFRIRFFLILGFLQFSSGLACWRSWLWEEFERPYK